MSHLFIVWAVLGATAAVALTLFIAYHAFIRWITAPRKPGDAPINPHIL
jgi:hypothetical protein